MKVQSTNRNRLFMGTGRFYFAPGATNKDQAEAMGYGDMGNVTAFEIQPTIEKQVHSSGIRGKVVEDYTRVKKVGLAYSLKFDEVLDAQKFAMLLMGSSAGSITQAVITAAAADEFDFSTTPAVAGKWYKIRKAGALVRKITAAVVIADGAPDPVTLEEEVDYVIDKALGMIKFAADQDTDVNITITAGAIAAGDAANMALTTPLADAIKSGYGEIALFDSENPNELVYHHMEFSCELSADGNATFTGDNFAELGVIVKVTGDEGVAANFQALEDES
jgi:hypothetical protein